MLRKTSITTLLLLSFSTPAWCHGFYIGLGGGPEIVNFKQTSFVNDGILGGFDVKNLSHPAGSGLFGSLFGGYAWTRNQYYLAGEANIDISSVDARSENDEYLHKNFSHTDLKMQHAYGFSLLPGCMVTNTTLFYGRVGYTNSNLKISTNESTLANINTRLNGLRLGLGINQTFDKNFSGRFEYDHSSYQNAKFTVVDGAVTKATTINPQADQVEFAVIYSFA
ncbi:MAG: outer membrane beta-barrel protein [Pseudomonadota bacterium]